MDCFESVIISEEKNFFLKKKQKIIINFNAAQLIKSDCNKIEQSFFASFCSKKEDSSFVIKKYCTYILWNTRENSSNSGHGHKIMTLVVANQGHVVHQNLLPGSMR